jgi:rfaE bifunctional protein nucleotidyltransferase chain/domain
METLHNAKYHSLAEAIDIRLRYAHQKIILTNGCFDLLHAGHIQALQHTAKLGDQLWIALNDDDSISQLKGPGRPIQNLFERAFALSALACVSGIFSFHNTHLAEEIALFRPDIYAKSGDYTLETLHPEERAALERMACEICFIPFLKGYSTTQLIERIRQRYP